MQDAPNWSVGDVREQLPLGLVEAVMTDRHFMCYLLCGRSRFIGSSKVAALCGDKRRSPQRLRTLEEVSTPPNPTNHFFMMQPSGMETGAPDDPVIGPRNVEQL